jgi:hypothetical protein
MFRGPRSTRHGANVFGLLDNRGTRVAAMSIVRCAVRLVPKGRGPWAFV